MDFDKFLHDNLADAARPVRQEFYARMEARLRDILAARGAADHEVVTTLNRFHIARGIHESRRRAAESRVGGEAAPRPAGDDPPPSPMDEAPPAVEAPQQRSPQVQIPPSEARPHPAPRRSRPVALLLVVVLASAAGAWLLRDAPDLLAPESRLRKDYLALKPGFEANLAYLKRLEEALRRHRDSTGAFPATAGFERMSEAKAAWPEEIARLLAESPERAAKLLYRGTSSNFKVVYYLTGDCFVASVAAPELVDPWRKFGPVDCIHYGLWTPDAATW